MRSLNQLRMRLLTLFRRRSAVTRLDDELQFHLDRQIAENLAAGMSPQEARFAALRTFGNPALLREETRATWSWNWLESLLRDLRFSGRGIRRAPGFAALMVLTLAIGIGANTAIFLLTWTILLKGLPVPQPGELIRYTFRKADSDIGLSYPQYQAIQKQQTVASGIFAWENSEATLRLAGQPEKISIAMSTGHVFGVLKLRPFLGRGFASDAGEPGSAYQPEALITYDLWQTRFHSDFTIVGQPINIENQNITIIGVLPPGFDGVQQERRISVLLPLSFEAVLHGKSSMVLSPGAFWLTVMGRLRPGETLNNAQSNLAAIQKFVNEAADPKHTFLNGGFFSGYTLGVESGRSGRSWLRTQYSRPLLVLEGLCGLMMLLCAVNAALLVLSRVSSRLHEFAMRSALGATRRRLLAQVIVETTALAFCGLGAGSLLGWELASLLVSMISGPGSPPILHLRVGIAVILFASAITIGAALAAGIWPAWRASRTAPIADLKQVGAQRSSRRLGRWIIPAQVALGVLMLNAALLLTGTLLTYLKEDSGFAADDVVLAQLERSDTGPQVPEAPRVLELLHQTQGMPGVRAAALMSMPPISNGFSVSDYYSHNSNGSLLVNRQVWPESVSAQYFPVMGTRLLEGRGFTPSDAQGDRTCILSQSAAAYFFANRSALGESLNNGDGTEKVSQRKSCRVIGIAADARMASLLQPPPLVVYLPIEQRSESDDFANATLAVRAANSQLAADAIRRAFPLAFPGAPLPKTYLFRDSIKNDLSRQRLLGSVSGGFAILALALLAAGLYGVLSRTVNEQRRDIGICMALGAKRQRIVIALARTAALRIATGLLAGAILAAFAARLLRSQLVGVSFQSPAIVLETLGVLLCVLIAAFIVPAGRAASVDPMQALRTE